MATAIASNTAQGPTRARCYRDGVLTDEGFGHEAVSEHLEGGGVVRVDLCPSPPR